MLSPDGYAPAFHSRRRQMPDVNIAKTGKTLAHPAPKAPRIFADTATISEIQPLFEAGIINGVTTNPTLLKKAGAKNWEEAKAMMKDICQLLNPYPVSLELTELEYDKMIAQAEELRQLGENSVIKVPTGGYPAVDEKFHPHTGLRVLRALWERDIKTNATLIFNSTQATWAAMAGATYVSPFLGRLADYAYQEDHPERTPGNSLYYVENHKAPEAVANTEFVASGGPRKDIGARLIQEIAQIFANYDIRTEILAASFRHEAQVAEVLLAGADILTVPSNLLQSVADHPLSLAGMKIFYEDSKAFAE